MLDLICRRLTGQPMPELCLYLICASRGRPRPPPALALPEMVDVRARGATRPGRHRETKVRLRRAYRLG